MEKEKLIEWLGKRIKELEQEKMETARGEGYVHGKIIAYMDVKTLLQFGE
jgi:hypothetical protein